MRLIIEVNNTGMSVIVKKHVLRRYETHKTDSENKRNTKTPSGQVSITLQDATVYNLRDNGMF